MAVASLVEAKAISARDKQLRQDLVTPAEVYSREHAFTANVTLDFSLLVGDRLDGDSASMLWSDVPAQTPIWQLVDAIAFTLDRRAADAGRASDSRCAKLNAIFGSTVLPHLKLTHTPVSSHNHGRPTPRARTHARARAHTHTHLRTLHELQLRTGGAAAWLKT